MEKQFLIILILINFLFFQVIAYIEQRFPNYGSDDISRVWNKIDDYSHGLEIKISDFLYDNNITNCFEHQEDLNHLLLKCWSFEDLVDVSILIRRNNLLPILYEKPSTNIAIC